MLSIELRILTPSAGEQVVRTGTIARVRGGRVSDYDVHLEAFGPVPHAVATLKNYPRWSESVTGLVARCIDASLTNEAEAATCWSQRSELTLTVQLNRRVEVAALTAEVCEGELRGPGGRIAAPRSESPATPWRAAAWLAASAAWGGAEIPAVPARVEVPVYRRGSTPYCRFGDLPPEAASVYARWGVGKTCPYVPGVVDAVFAWDMNDFLGWE